MEGRRMEVSGRDRAGTKKEGEERREVASRNLG